jgi:molecular chaperone HtpG
MTITLASAAEVSASRAEELTAFSGIKLLKVKQELELALLLELIGREEIFSEYTRHDISHIDRMLEMLDWLIPNSTKSILTPADWLTTVLSIYFHDLGMLVTRNEYKARNSSGFPAYRDNVLFAGEKGADYQAKVAEMGEDAGERFLYQEFVRSAHADKSMDNRRLERKAGNICRCRRNPQ